MSQDYEKLKKIGPTFDCGKCGNASCLAFIRRLTVGDEEITTCPFIPEETREKMMEILARLGKEREKEKVEDIVADQNKELPLPPADKEYSPECAEGDHTATTLQFSPCAEKEKVTLEVHLALPSNKGYSLLDSCDMCRTLSSMKTMDRVSCSQQMGYAAALLDGKRIHIFKNGKVIIRKADSKGSALDILKNLKIAMRPSVINNCGNTLADSLLCHDCMLPECGTALFWGVPPKLTRDYLDGIRGGREDDEIAGSNAGPKLPVIMVLRNFITELCTSLEKGTECTKLTREAEESMSFLKELPGNMKEMMDVVSSEEEYDVTELHSSALVFQNNLTALALERSMTEDEPADLATAFYGVAVHAMGMAVARALSAATDLLNFRSGLETDGEMEYRKLVDNLFSSVFLESVTLLEQSLAVLLEGTTGDSNDASALVKVMSSHGQEARKASVTTEAKLTRLTEESNTESLYLVFACLWKLVYSTRSLCSLMGKEILIPGRMSG